MDFINSPALYLEKVNDESVVITEKGHDIAMLTKPSKTPISDSLVGLLKGSGIKNMRDIKKLRLGE
jgi:hypothetical protein